MPFWPYRCASHSADISISCAILFKDENDASILSMNDGSRNGLAVAATPLDPLYFMSGLASAHSAKILRSSACRCASGDDLSYCFCKYAAVCTSFLNVSRANLFNSSMLNSPAWY